VKKSTIAVLAVLLALAAGVAVLAILNGKGSEAKRRLQDDDAFLIMANGAEQKISMAEFQKLPLREIQANYKKNGKAPEVRAYTGAPFAEVLRMAGVDPEGLTKAIFSAADNYTSALRIDEALDEENCFIVIAEAGVPLGKREDGGTGPFRMIMARDQFSQRWCSFLTDVVLE